MVAFALVYGVLQILISRNTVAWPTPEEVCAPFSPPAPAAKVRLRGEQQLTTPVPYVASAAHPSVHRPRAAEEPRRRPPHGRSERGAHGAAVPARTARRGRLPPPLARPPPHPRPLLRLLAAPRATLPRPATQAPPRLYGPRRPLGIHKRILHRLHLPGRARAPAPSREQTAALWPARQERVLQAPGVAGARIAVPGPRERASEAGRVRGYERGVCAPDWPGRGRGAGAGGDGHGHGREERDVGCRGAGRARLARGGLRGAEAAGEGARGRGRRYVPLLPTAPDYANPSHHHHSRRARRAQAPPPRPARPAPLLPSAPAAPRPLRRRIPPQIRLLPPRPARPRQRHLGAPEARAADRGRAEGRAGDGRGGQARWGRRTVGEGRAGCWPGCPRARRRRRHLTPPGAGSVDHRLCADAFLTTALDDADVHGR
ncbi:hypothetical protein CALCODRAFT_110412 [Calocera cornea HHB12733]|uniref:Uncharacterized protein n=1 Tax=Calocera cornea HHB12733 TaxID=1353952 RepID=A0A165D280_9BASI|nr:hypothetical protein CALCODRAFT_110412 [Calocera cornea HHB12733]